VMSAQFPTMAGIGEVIEGQSAVGSETQSLQGDPIRHDHNESRRSVWLPRDHPLPAANRDRSRPQHRRIAQAIDLRVWCQFVCFRGGRGRSRSVSSTRGTHEDCRAGRYCERPAGQHCSEMAAPALRERLPHYRNAPNVIEPGAHRRAPALPSLM
jgi:hypothetical protein